MAMVEFAMADFMKILLVSDTKLAAPHNLKIVGPIPSIAISMQCMWNI